MSSRILKMQFEQPWSLRIWRDQENYRAIDEQLLAQVIRREAGPGVCIGSQPRCLVSTLRESQMDGFGPACAQLAARGWPVQIRCTGGGCVPQGPGVLNLSLVHPQRAGWKLADGYLLLGELLSELLTGYGLTATLGEVAGAFCDGRYNLQVSGRKLVGTAQRWAGSRREQPAVLAHACLLVDLDLAEATDRINSLYRLCGNEQQYDRAWTRWSGKGSGWPVPTKAEIQGVPSRR